MSKPIYFNFPVELLTNYLFNPIDVLNDIYYYALWNYAKDLYVDYDTYNKVSKEDLIRYNIDLDIKEEGFNDEENYTLRDKLRFILAEDKYCVSTGNVNRSIERGKELVRKYNNTKPPFSNISTEIWFEYYKKEKTEWENIMLLAFLAVRSIIGEKGYCKITNDFLFARMCGLRTKIKNKKELNKTVQKYYTEYYKNKIRTELELYWHLKTYNGRGYYASFDMEYKDLIRAIKLNSKTNRMKVLAREKKAIAKEIDLELNK